MTPPSSLALVLDGLIAFKLIYSPEGEKSTLLHPLLPPILRLEFHEGL